MGASWTSTRTPISKHPRPKADGTLSSVTAIFRARTVQSPTEKAKKELNKYNAFKHSIYLPKMKPKKVLGAIDVNGYPKAPYELGPVVSGVWR